MGIWKIVASVIFRFRHRQMSRDLPNECVCEYMGGENTKQYMARCDEVPLVHLDIDV